MIDACIVNKLELADGVILGSILIVENDEIIIISKGLKVAFKNFKVSMMDSVDSCSKQDEVAVQYCSYGSNGIEIFNNQNSIYQNKLQEFRIFKYSPNGSTLALVTKDHVKLLNSSSLSSLEIPVSALDIEFSALGNYISIYERYCKPTVETDSHKNVSIFDSSSGKLIFSYTQKTQSLWSVQWSCDEAFFARLVTNEVQFYETANAILSGTASVKYRLKLDNIASFSISIASPVVAIFCSEKNGSPAQVLLYKIGEFDFATAKKAFYRADSVQYFWNSVGTHLLVFAHTDVDNTGQSYYGETNLYYLSTSGNFDCRIDLDQTGPIHEVTWNPNGREFVVVYGTVPSKSTLFDHRASPIFEFGRGAWNSVKFNSRGRLLYLAGFGNLAGEMEIWDRKLLKKVSSFNASNSSSCEWSPDGRHIMTTTLYKRLKVDNGFKIWHYSGALVHHTETKEMYQVSWKPAPAILWTDRTGNSPPPASIQSNLPSTAKPMGVYRPPGARGGSLTLGHRESLDSLSSKFKSTKSIPGFAGDKKSTKPKNSKKNNRMEEIQQPAPEPLIVGKDPEKRIKALKKKIKQIEDIKLKIEAGLDVELTQIKKLEAEDEILKELSELTLGNLEI